MAGYSDTKKLIEDTLVGRPEGSLIYPYQHQRFALSMLDYIHSVELMGVGTFQGIAATDTVPVEPENAKVAYIATVPPSQTYVYTNFLDENGDPITITTEANTVSLLTLLWNGTYWQVQNTPVQLAVDYSEGFLLKDVISTDIDPGTPDLNIFYIALPGTYTHFTVLPIVIEQGELGIITYENSAWQVEKIEAGGGDTYTTDTQDADLEFSDESGNVLAQLSDGHFKTKYFDSRNLQAEDGIKIFFIGNSLTQDAVGYVPLLLKELAPELKFSLYVWYKGSGTLAQHYSMFVNNTNCPIFSIYKSVDNAWTNYNNSKNITWILQNCDFNIVCLQEYNNVSETDEAFKTNFNNLVNYIADHYNKAFKVVYLTDAPKRSDVSTYMSRAEHYATVSLKHTMSESIIPAGESIYNALQTSLSSLGDQGELSTDGIHAQEGLPCMIEAYCVAAWILEEKGIAKSIYNSRVRITQTVYNQLDVPGPNLGTGLVLGTDAQYLIAQQCAIKAIKQGKGLVINASGVSSIVESYADGIRSDLDDIRRSIALEKTTTLYKTLSGYNTAYPNATINPVTIFSGQGVNPNKRIPSICLTNNGAVLVACEDRASGDFGEVNIMIGKYNGVSWVYSTVLSYSSSTYGKGMNPCLVCDRTGQTGYSGRIFLFMLTTNHSSGAGFYSPAANSDIIYKYSDDNGATWSSSISLKYLWTKEYNIAVPSPSRGIQMSDGTLCVPICFNVDTADPTTQTPSHLRSGMLFKHPGGEWELTNPTPNAGDNECEVYENNGVLYLLVRNELHAKKNCYYYDFALKTWVEYSDYWQSDKVICQNPCIGFVYHGKRFFMRTYFDSPNARQNLTLMESVNSFNYAKVLQITNATTKGYSSIDFYNGRLVIAFEGDNTINYMEMTNALDFFESIHNDLSTPIITA